MKHITLIKDLKHERNYWFRNKKTKNTQIIRWSLSSLLETLDHYDVIGPVDEDSNDFDWSTSFNKILATIDNK